MDTVKSNYEIAKIEADKTDQKIIETLCSRKSFRVEAGAGSGKTYSLNKVIEWLQDNRWNEFKIKKQRGICITYTNVAVDVIASRLKPNSFIEPSTIHSFAWSAMKQYQSTLIKLVGENNLLPEDADIDDINNVTYTLGARYVDGTTLHLFHNDVIKLFSLMLDNVKFRNIFSKVYPLILIDEYQDSFKIIIDKFLSYFIQNDTGPQFGFFGDSWQTIYQLNNVCGLIDDEKIDAIPKGSNFRSAPNIVNFLNKIRPNLPQISAIDDYEGEVIVIHSNDYNSVRRTDRNFKDDLPFEILEERLSATEKLFRETIMQPEENLKILMLTHRVLAAQQGYSNLLDLLGDAFRNEEDEILMFFMNTIEPIFEALKSNNTQLLFESLGVRRYPINTKAQKKEWSVLKDKLEHARQGIVSDVLNIAIKSKLIPMPPAVTEIGKNMTEAPDTLYRNGTISNLANIAYNEFVSGIEFLRPSAIYSTDHGVKGEEYDNVIFVIGRGWNNYNFEKYIPMNPATVSADDQSAYERNRNLFYVCCSRPKKRLVLFITTPFEGNFKAYIENLVGKDSVFSFGEYIKKNKS
ncbi:MAG: AAA family ATPase [Bacteroidales bacterium]|jgi:DNA helicase-2/ATP-dependent DNA helicase PcrA|nr:AAA family ATPase [Bacteroidales bacterium]